MEDIPMLLVFFSIHSGAFLHFSHSKHNVRFNEKYNVTTIHICKDTYDFLYIKVDIQVFIYKDSLCCAI